MIFYHLLWLSIFVCCVNLNKSGPVNLMWGLEWNQNQPCRCYDRQKLSGWLPRPNAQLSRQRAPFCLNQSAVKGPISVTSLNHPMTVAPYHKPTTPDTAYIPAGGLWLDTLPCHPQSCRLGFGWPRWRYQQFRWQLDPCKTYQPRRLQWALKILLILDSLAMCLRALAYCWHHKNTHVLD